MSSFALLDQLKENELDTNTIMSFRSKHQSQSKKKAEKKSLYREEFSHIAFNEVIWFQMLTFLDFKFLFQSCARIDKMRCEMIYSKPMCQHVLICEFFTLLNGEEEKDTRVWFKKFMPLKPMTKVLTNADPQCLFKEIRELVSESCSDLKDQTFTTPSHISSIIYPLTLRTYSGKDTFPVFVKLFHKLSNRKFLIRGLNNQLRKRYPQYKAPTYYTNLFQTHESAIDPHTRRQFHCNHFENVIQKISAHPLKMTSQCKAYGISMDISHYTPEHRNRKH